MLIRDPEAQQDFFLQRRDQALCDGLNLACAVLNKPSLFITYANTEDLREKNKLKITNGMEAIREHSTIPQNLKN